MTMEPDYLRQTAEWAGMDANQRDAWWRETFEEMKAIGCTWMRRSVDSDEPTMALCEGWKERPADEGPIRWQMTDRTPCPS